MANKIQIKRGNKANLPALSDGEFGFCTDTNELYIGNGGTNHSVALTGGSNFIRFDDGTMIEWGQKNFGGVAMTTAWGSFYRSGDLVLDNFPIAFVGTPSVTINGSLSQGSPFTLVCGGGVSSTSPGIYGAAAGTSGGIATCILNYTAIGKWR